jgi:hypothetical protein
MMTKLEVSIYKAFLAAGKQLGEKAKGLSCLVRNWGAHAPLKVGMTIILLCLLLGACVPIWIAAGVEIEHDEWCRTHMTDSHCR